MDMDRARPEPGWNRRRFLTASSAAAAGLLLAACGRPSGDSGSPPGSGSGGTGSDDGFPVELTGALGTIRLEKRPARVVTVGWLRDPDIAVALGVIPVGVTRQALLSEGMTPWLAEAVGSSPPVLLADSPINLEQIAGLRPDLILATDDYDLERNYTPLSGIAPTLSYKTGVGSDSWQTMTNHIAPALGLARQAADLVSKVEEQIARARRANPEFEGKTFIAGAVAPGGKLDIINSTEDASVALWSQLGLVLAPAVAKLPKSSTPNRADVSLEQVGLLDADLLILTAVTEGDRERFESQPLVQQLPVVRRGGYVAQDLASAFAFGFPSVLSIPYGLSKTLPKVKAALAA